VLVVLTSFLPQGPTSWAAGCAVLKHVSPTILSVICSIHSFLRRFPGPLSPWTMTILPRKTPAITQPERAVPGRKVTISYGSFEGRS